MPVNITKDSANRSVELFVLCLNLNDQRLTHIATQNPIHLYYSVGDVIPTQLIIHTSIIPSKNLTSLIKGRFQNLKSTVKILGW